MKRKLPIILALMLAALLMFTACNKTDGNVEDGTEAETKAEETKAEETEAQTEAETSPYPDISRFVDPEHGNFVFAVKDYRANKTDLSGKYVCTENPELFFEIKDDQAILYYTFAWYHGFIKEAKAQELVITEEDGVVALSFEYHRKDSNIVNTAPFYAASDNTGTFTWGADPVVMHFVKE